MMMMNKNLLLILEQKIERIFNQRKWKNRNQIRMHITISKRKIPSKKIFETKKKRTKSGIGIPIIIVTMRTAIRKTMLNLLLAKTIKNLINIVHPSFMGSEKTKRWNRWFRSPPCKMSLIIMKLFVLMMFLRRSQKDTTENRGKMSQATMWIHHKNTPK